MSLVCKMYVGSVISSPTAGEKQSETIQLHAVAEGSEKNKQWAKLTPTASLNMHIDNPSAWGKLKVGDHVLVTLDPCGPDD
jgi:hypothetical protein